MYVPYMIHIVEMLLLFAWVTHAPVARRCPPRSRLVPLSGDLEDQVDAPQLDPISLTPRLRPSVDRHGYRG